MAGNLWHGENAPSSLEKDPIFRPKSPPIPTTWTTTNWAYGVKASHIDHVCSNLEEERRKIV